MSVVKHYMNNNPISIHNLYKYMKYLYKNGTIPEFKVHFNGDLTEIIFLTEYNSEKWGQEGTSIITYNINQNKWKCCINTKPINELYIEYPYLFENNLYTGITVINEDYLTFESENIDDILEPALNIFYNKNDQKNLQSTNTTYIYNMVFSDYHAFINNIIYRDSIINNTKYNYLNYNSFEKEYI